MVSYNLDKLPVFDDSNYQMLIRDDIVINGDKKSRGLVPRDYAANPRGSTFDFATDIDIPLIPESEWDARIEEQERTKSSLHHLMLNANIPVKDQNGTNYCWINAPVYCMEVIRCHAGLPYVELSPASVGGPIKGYRNNGGWGLEGLKYIVDHGVVPSSIWPSNGISARYNTAEAQAIRGKFRCTEWWEIPTNSLNWLATCLLLNHPVAIGLNWWGHEVTAIRLVKRGGQWAIVIANSWGEGWGEKGYGILTGRKMLPDDACTPRVAVATNGITPRSSTAFFTTAL